MQKYRKSDQYCIDEYDRITITNLLVLYGVVATWQTADFGRVYAAYGGIFIIMALIRAWKADNFQPDKWDVIGALVGVTGACIIIYMPRK
jgi:small multidrug resistance family-3 protein